MFESDIFFNYYDLQRIVTFGDSIAESLFNLASKERVQSLLIRNLLVNSLSLAAEKSHLGRYVLTSLASYADPDISACVRALKYENSRHAAHLLASLFSRWLESQSISSEKILLVPIPLHNTRMRERGFNQITRVLHRADGALLKKRQLSLATHVLKRIKNTSQQTKLSLTDRKKNIKNAFRVYGDVRHKKILLIDDVLTTGSTMREAARTLREAGAHVTCLVFARA